MGNSPAQSRQTSPRLSNASNGEVITNVKSQQTTPSISRQSMLTRKRSRLGSCYVHGIPAVKRTHSSPNLYSFLNSDAEVTSYMRESDHYASVQANMCVTNNPMWSTEIISECSHKCVSMLDRSSRLKIMKTGNSMIQSFSIQTITSSNAETFV